MHLESPFQWRGTVEIPSNESVIDGSSASILELPESLSDEIRMILNKVLSGQRISCQAVSYTHLTLPTNREV